jgi:hypothetical protein
VSPSFSGSIDRQADRLLGAPANQANPQLAGRQVALDITDRQSGNTDVWI